MAYRVHLSHSSGLITDMPSEKPGKNKGMKPIDLLPPDGVLFGRSAAMQEIRQRAAKVCETDIPVFLSGDAGTGKEVLARWIHKHSLRCNGVFVKVNCAAIPGALLESELFGYEKGAFTGAVACKPGRVELAQNGTLFLDEIADLDLGLQSKLLQFLQDGHFSRIGGETERAVDARLICASNKDLEREIQSGSFRADLYYRINVVRLRLPRLQERREDIAVLAEYFREQYEKQFAKESVPLDPEVLRYLRSLKWPGNLRELSNGIARYVLMGPEAAIITEFSKRSTVAVQASSGETNAIPLKRIAKKAIRDMERSVILETLRAHQWNRRKTAQALKISYRALIYKIRNAGLTRGSPELGTASGVDSKRGSHSSTE
jgi:two-component system, NtrC family, response regulator AtoC